MKVYKNIGIVIPARFDSSRLPGKPLIDLCGKSMIQRTWEQCIKVLPMSQVFIATESMAIKKHVDGFGGQSIMTSKKCLTGTDRIAEANNKLNLDLVINVQGDEPIIDPRDIEQVINYAKNNTNKIVNAIAEINQEEFESLSIPKVVKNISNELMYISRAPIPGTKTSKFKLGYKQICIYAFPKSALEFFVKNPKKSTFEDIEDIEILRFLEHGFKVQLVEVSGESMAVDTLADVEKVKQKITKKLKYNVN